MIKIKEFSCGYCRQFEKFAFSGGKWRMKKFPAKCFLISADGEYILFDTGYPSDFNNIMRAWPDILYKYLVPVNIRKQETCAEQLRKENIRTEDIKYIFISHFHADHIGALRDFPNARFVCSGIEYNKLKNMSALRQILNGFVSRFIPADFESRVICIERLNIKKDNIFSSCYELPFINDIFAVPLPGHTAGQFGLWLSTEKILLAADSAWMKENYTQASMPHGIALRFCDDKTSLLKTLTLLKSLKNIKIFLSHGEN